MKITVRDRGPLRVELGEGEEITLVDGQERIFGLGGRRVLSLCRCGESANKPFCDGAHGRAGFDSACEARDLPPAGGPASPQSSRG
ncbi:MAG TPA: CDGSH iron-sulfur domain-containing protein [Thermoanaerobaculia bacterium]|nr:CDGSH iron-sulfur domain-containing protein [Thermoanaerobaculia bacterium]